MWCWWGSLRREAQRKNSWGIHFWNWLGLLHASCLSWGSTGTIEGGSFWFIEIVFSWEGLHRSEAMQENRKHWGAQHLKNRRRLSMQWKKVWSLLSLWKYTFARKPDMLTVNPPVRVYIPQRSPCFSLPAKRTRRCSFTSHLKGRKKGKAYGTTQVEHPHFYLKPTQSSTSVSEEHFFWQKKWERCTF